MSVAFRRESDEEHKEPRFELPIPVGPNLVTERGYDLIEARAEQLEEAVRVEEGEERRAELQRDLRYWRNRLASAQVAPTPSAETVAFGTRVTFEQGGHERSLSIVGHDEADPANGLLAFSSPLGQALIGSEVGEDVTVPGPHGSARIIAIEVR